MQEEEPLEGEYTNRKHHSQKDVDEEAPMKDMEEEPIEESPIQSQKDVEDMVDAAPVKEEDS